MLLPFVARYFTHTSSGSVLGSVLGGKWSDRVFRKLKEKHGGKSEPEVRAFPVADVLVPVHVLNRMSDASTSCMPIHGLPPPRCGGIWLDD